MILIPPYLHSFAQNSKPQLEKQTKNVLLKSTQNICIRMGKILKPQCCKAAAVVRREKFWARS